MKRTAYFGLSLLLMCLAIEGFAQAPAAGPQFKSKAAYDAYNAAFTEKGPAQKATLAEKFLADYKDEDISFRTNAYMMMVKGYDDSSNAAKTFDAASKVTEVLPTVDAGKKAQVYSYALDAAVKTDNVAKAIEFGDKVLAIAPEDANTLITLAGLIPERLPTADADKKAALDKAADYATKALAAVAKIFGGPKPAGMSDADWTGQKTGIEAGLHADLGFVALNKVDYDKSVSEYETAIKGTPKDGLSLFRLGLAYNGQATALTKAYLESIKVQNDAIAAKAADDQINDMKGKSAALETSLRAKRDQAIDTLATAVNCGGAAKDAASTQLNKLYGTKTDGDMSGLPALLEAKKCP